MRRPHHPLLDYEVLLDIFLSSWDTIFNGNVRLVCEFHSRIFFSPMGKMEEAKSSDVLSLKG